jgi:hypothetical protein
MRYYPSLKSVLEWTFLGIFLFLVLAAFMICHGSDETGGWQSIDRAKTVDNDDIEEKVTPARTGSGVVWGTTNKTPPPAEVATPAPATATLSPPAPLPVTPQRAATSQAGKYLLKSNRQKGSTDLVETLLEVTGEAKQVSGELKEVKDKMEVVAGFRYEERIDQFSAAARLVSIRQYNLAKSKMKIGNEIRMPELPNELQTIVCSVEKDGVPLFSPHGSLRGEQLLLIEDIPGNTLTIDRLLPNTEVAIGESWKISDGVVRSFLSIDAVTASNVEAVLTAVADNMAMIEVVGDVSGVHLGAATEMSVRAKFQFDLSIQRINWLGAMIEENRSIGHVGPGLDLVARLQVKISPIDAPQSLTDNTIMMISTKPTPAVMQLKYDGGKGPWRFSHDRSWYVYQDEPQTTVLRKLMNGELVAQCNIADMGTVDLKTMTTLDKFQRDLIAGLGKNFGKIAAAGEYETNRGYKIYKVLLDGMVDDLSLRWIYHLVTDREGRQSVVVFVVEAAMLDQFGDADDVLMETYRMGR